MTEPNTTPEPQEKSEEFVLDPSNLDEQRHGLVVRFQEMLQAGQDEAVRELALGLSPGDLSEILRPLNVDDTTRILRMLPADPLAEVLSEIDNRSLSTLFTLLDNAEIADIIEEMPSDEATDLLAELDPAQAEEILAEMEEEERGEVAELLRHSPESAGGLMGKEYTTCLETDSCGKAVALLRSLEEGDLEETHSVYVVDGRGRLVGIIPLFKLLIAKPETPAAAVMETDPLYVEVDLDQEEVAGFFLTHALISVPVVDHQMRLVGRITVDDVLDVMEEEATEDISRLAGVSVEEFGEKSSFRVARSRLPWLLGAMVGQLGAVLVLGRFQATLGAKLALAFYIPMIMATAGNIGIQTSSVVVRGLATGEVDLFHLGHHLLRELKTALLTGVGMSLCILGLSFAFSGDLHLSQVLSLSMVLVVLYAAMVGSGIPMMLHRFGIDPAVATGPFITTANDVVSMLIYLGIATLMLHLGQPPS